jgi:hypothetical protein
MLSPRSTADIRNMYGSILPFQSAESFEGAIKKTAPSEDWCSVERSTPKITTPTIILLTNFRALGIFNFSKNIGLASVASVEV